MNVGIVAYWPDDAFIESNFGRKRWMSFYIFVMQAFGADTLFLIGAPKIESGYDMNIVNYDSVNDLIKDHHEYSFIILTGVAEKTLQEYEHPDSKAIYVFGNDYADVPDIPGDRIRIENLGDVKSLWSHNCVSIVLYDRYLKNGVNK